MDGEARSLKLAADRMFILAETFDVYVRDHPAVVADLGLTESATVAAGAMFDLFEQINAKLPAGTDDDRAQPLDRMRILTETFDLYVREDQAVTSSLRLSVRAFLLNRALQTFSRHLTARLQNALKETTP